MTPDILTVVTATSSVIGLLALLAYFYFAQRLAEVRRSERSVRKVIAGEGLFNPEQVLNILREFEDDTARLEALKTFANINNQTAKRVYSKIKDNVDIGQLDARNVKSQQQQALWTAAFFLAITLVALVYAILPHSGTPSDGHPSPPPSATVVATPSPISSTSPVPSPKATSMPAQVLTPIPTPIPIPTEVVLQVVIHVTKVNDIVEFKAESDTLGHEVATGHLGVGDYQWTWHMGPPGRNIWFWWDTMNGAANITIKVNGEVLFDGSCVGGRNGEVSVISTCSQPDVYRTSGSPRLVEGG